MERMQPQVFRGRITVVEEVEIRRFADGRLLGDESFSGPSVNRIPRCHENAFREVSRRIQSQERIGQISVALAYGGGVRRRIGGRGRCEETAMTESRRR